MRFEAQVSGDRDLVLEGDAVHSDYATQFFVTPPLPALGAGILLTTRSPLDDEEEGHTINLLLREAAPGTYTLGARSEASAIFSEQSDSLWTMASGVSGTVTLHEVTFERIRGTFRFQTEQALTAPLLTYGPRRSAARQPAHPAQRLAPLPPAGLVAARPTGIPRA